MRLKLLLSLVILAAAAPALAVDPVNRSLFGGVAIKGYDPVAYFVQSKPAKGSDDFEFEWMGATWRFVSARNRDAFKSTPEKYAPQYGGYCAWAVSQGYTAGIDPDAWKIVDGRLYLNHSKDVQKDWEADIAGNIRKADENWPKLLKE